MIYENKIPSLIHQIWLGDNEIPNDFMIFSETWKYHHPKWQYRLWNEAECLGLLNQKYSNLIAIYDSFPFLIQKVDFMKYLILIEYGGLYVDLDYECFKPIDVFMKNCCCLGLEPVSNARSHKRKYFIGNAFMASIPKFSFFECLIYEILNFHKTNQMTVNKNKFRTVMESTGPVMLNNQYRIFHRKEDIFLLSSLLIAPFDQGDALLFRTYRNDINSGLENIFAIHHFYTLW